jgi:alkylhydroperoxidase/carboxymuconolactone decarboxylase family protein YurZ
MRGRTSSDHRPDPTAAGNGTHRSVHRRGTLPQLREALTNGLDAGLSISEIALASLDGVDSQLQSHLGIALNTGLTETNLRDLVAVLCARVGRAQADRATTMLDKVLA